LHERLAARGSHDDTRALIATLSTHDPFVSAAINSPPRHTRTSWSGVVVWVVVGVVVVVDGIVVVGVVVGVAAEVAVVVCVVVGVVCEHDENDPSWNASMTSLITSTVPLHIGLMIM
jgi:hypothetical protein